MPKKSTDKPPALTGEDPLIIVYAEGHYFVFSIAQGLRHIATKDDKHTEEKHIDPWKDLAQMFEPPRDFSLHFIDRVDAGTLALQSRHVKDAILIDAKSFLPVQKKKEERVIDETVARATEVLGSRGEGMRWLGNPVRALDFATPISLLGTPEGVERVNDILGQIEHGVW